MPPVALAIGAVASVVGTIGSLNAQRKAARAQERQEQLASRRSRRAAIREMQIRRAQLLATGQGLGAQGSSAVAGGAGSLGSQLGAELGFSSSMSALSGIITRQTQRAANFNALTQIGGGLMNWGMSQGASFSDFFNKKPTPAPTPSTVSAYTGPSYAPRPRQFTGSTPTSVPYRTQFTPI